MLKGFVLICSINFEVEEFIYNGFADLELNRDKLLVADLFDYEEDNKVEALIDILNHDGIAFNIDIPFKNKSRSIPLKISGSKFEEGFFVFGLEIGNNLPILYQELLHINNEKASGIRAILKDEFLKEHLRDRSDTKVFDELSKLNNDLANLQRELSKKNSELSRLSELRNQFLGMAAHDLRNPLNNIYNFARLIEDHESNLSDSQIKFLSNIISQSQYMAKIVNELLDFSAIESGHINLNLEEVNLVEIIATSVDLHKHMAEKKSIHISSYTAIPMLKVNVDVGKIEQVLSNLITNAIKYSDPGKSVQIFIVKLDASIEVGVKDEGQGIEENELEYLFKPFQKTSSIATAGESSTGLGLFISKRIIEAHKGEIWAESTKDKGSVFYFSIPKYISPNVAKSE